MSLCAYVAQAQAQTHPFTFVDSEISVDSNFDADAETMGDRMYALRDIIPPTTRGWIHNRYQAASRFGKTALLFCGRAAWAVSVTALMIGVPFALAYAEEQNLIAMEQEQRMREMGGELLTAGGEKDSSTADRVGAALGNAEARPAL